VPRFIAALKELRDIGLFDNRLTAYPDCLRPLKKLEKVNLESNPFPPAELADPDRIRRVEGLYLVDGEAGLCGGCLDKCRSQRRKVEARAEVKVKPRRMFAGLLTPNSVAQVDQETWR